MKQNCSSEFGKIASAASFERSSGFERFERSEAIERLERLERKLLQRELRSGYDRVIQMLLRLSQSLTDKPRSRTR